MLSYRHAFHAGNHADVLKHAILVQLIGHLTQKNAAFWYVDTHAGAGMYALDSGYAAKLAEYRDGIGRLWSRDDLPAALADYRQLVRQANPDDTLRHYPGSPWIAERLMREQDRLRLFELHGSDVPLLAQTFAKAGRRVAVAAGDGYAGLKALLPPPPRRGLVLIDPSYETRDDYRQVVDALREALKRFATGCYALWYPQLARQEARQLPARLKALPHRRWLHASLSVAAPAASGIGMHGSGMFVINPPWTLHATLQQMLPYLAATLGRDGGAGYELEHGEA